VVALLARLGHWKRRDLPAFGELSRPANATPSRRRDALLTVLHLSMESAVEAEQLRLSTARRLASEALALCQKCFGPDFSGGRMAASIEARLLYEQDKVDDADRLIRDRLVLTGAEGGVEGALATYTVGARIAVARGQTAFAILLLREAEELGRQRDWVRLVATSLAERVRLLLDADRATEAADCMRKLRLLSSASMSHENRLYVGRQITVAQARLQLSEGADASTAEALRTLVVDCQARGEHRLVVELKSLHACVLLNIGRPEEARREALEALTAGSAAGLYRTFLDGGKAMRQLLSWLDEGQRPDGIAIGELRPYLRSLIAGLPQHVAQPPSARGRHRSGESLSARERHILTLISHGLSNKRIAKELGIAPETVKSHAKHILLKLAAQTRVEAVSRALSLGII
jgi:LuxR family maltose regulon positive regulatory protein